MTPRKALSWVVPRSYPALLLLVVFETGCHRSASTSQEKVAKQRLAWNLQTTVEAYNKIGVKNAQWDESARKCLAEFARTRSAIVSSNEPAGKIISTNAANAVDAGCTDPMVTYLYIRFALPQTNSKVEFANRLYATAQAMNGSSYPPVRKFYASARAIEQYYYAYDTQKDLKARDESFGLLTALLELVDQTLSDKTIPLGEASEVADQAVALAGRTDFHNETMFYDRVEQALMKNFSGDYLPWYLKGSHCVKSAWNARGDGYANTVTKEGWESFKTNLVVAREALEHAWKLNPREPNIATEMMSVELGQGSDRQEMELWFDRAMKLDTNSYSACCSKEQFLEPKWYGTDEEAVAFGRECVHSTNWGGHIPIVLVLAHNDINSRLTGAAKTEYWKQPEVWEDIKSAYDRYFELNPEETHVYNAYVLHAYQAEQWAALNELIPKLTTTNYDMFGGKSEFDKMIRLAREHGSAK
jgi:hypothetical protein